MNDHSEHCRCAKCENANRARELASIDTEELFVLVAELVQLKKHSRHTGLTTAQLDRFVAVRTEIGRRCS